AAFRRNHPFDMRKVTKMGPAWSSPHRQGVNRSVHGATRIRVNYFPNQKESMTVVVRTCLRAYRVTFFRRQISVLQSQKFSAAYSIVPPDIWPRKMSRRVRLRELEALPLGRNSSPNRVPAN